MSSVVLTGPDSGGGDGSCAKKVTCTSRGRGCGPIDNGCGGIIQCGSCPAGQTCGGGGKPSECGTAVRPDDAAPGAGSTAARPATAAAAAQCGTAGDAGTCGGGGGAAGVCGTSAASRRRAPRSHELRPRRRRLRRPLGCGACTAPGDLRRRRQPSVCGHRSARPRRAPLGPGSCGPAARRLRRPPPVRHLHAPETCGGARRRTSAGAAATCTGLCLQAGDLPPARRDDDASAARCTRRTGVDPLPNVLVYIPNAAVRRSPPASACETRATDGVRGSPLVSAATDTHGNFTLQNVPVGTNIPLVIQTGRWRRQRSSRTSPRAPTPRSRLHGGDRRERRMPASLPADKGRRATSRSWRSRRARSTRSSA